MNTVVKISVTLVLGVGASLLAPRAALATTPCPMEDKPKDQLTCGVTAIDSNAQRVCVPKDQTNLDIISSCRDLDGDCTPDTKFKGHRYNRICDIKSGGSWATYNCVEDVWDGGSEYCPPPKK